MASRWEVDELDWDRVRDQIRQRLEDTARDKRLIPYSDLVDGIPEIDGPHSHALADMLGEISAQCYAESLPLLSALAVYKHSKEPGPGFYAAVRRLSVEPGTTSDAKHIYWAREVDRCHTAWRDR